MQPFNLDARILLLSTLCFSFLNYVFTVSTDRRIGRFRLMGTAFFIPLVLSAFAFFYWEQTDIVKLSALGDTLLLLALLAAIGGRGKDRGLRYKEAAYYAVSAVLALYLFKYKGMALFAPLSAAQYFIQIVLILIMMGLLKRQKNDEVRLYSALTVFLFSAVLGSFPEYEYLPAFHIAFRIGAYILFYHCFSNRMRRRYDSKVAETEDLKESLERALNVEVRKRMYAIEKSNERLLEMSKTDLMTKAYNKITILNLIEKLISKKERPFSILMFDIDHFKRINDTLGHVTGDLCLRTLASIASANIREMDYLGRYGGDEFIIVLPGLSTGEAKFVAERFRSRVSESSDPRLTVSIGIATYPEDGTTVKELISAADKGLYRSKSKGRNTVSHHKLF